MFDVHLAGALEGINDKDVHQPVLTAVRIYIKEKEWLGAMIAARDAPLINNHDILRPILHHLIPGHRWTLDVWIQSARSVKLYTGRLRIMGIMKMVTSFSRVIARKDP